MGSNPTDPTKMTTKQDVAYAIAHPFDTKTLRVKPFTLTISMTDEYFLVYEGRSGYYTKEGRLIMSYNRETGNWGLYVPDYVTNRVFKLIWTRYLLGRYPK